MTPLLCRVCLQVADDPIDITFALYRGTIKVTEMFSTITDIYLEEKSQANILCRDCESRLFAAYEFRCEANEAQKVLNISMAVKNEEQMIVECAEEEDEDFYWNENESPVIKKEGIKREGESKVRVKRRRSNQAPPQTPANRFQCRFCLQIVVEGLREHEKQHIIENGGFECEHCPKKFIDRDRVAIHLKAVHFSNRKDPNRPRYACDICNKTYTEKCSVAKHKRNHHSDVPIPREICPYCGKEQQNLKVHINTVHNATISCYCDFCQKGFKTKGALKVHIKHVHMNIKEFQCTICLKFYRSRREVKTHMEAVHVEEKRYQCDSCGKRFKAEASYNHHLKMHQADFDHICEVCDARFKSIHYLRGHMKVHSDVKDYVCSVCSAAFKRKEQLRRHMRGHEGIRFGCPLCPDVSFMDKGYLKEHHERVHIGIRYRCDVCFKDYGCKKHLVQHQKASKCDRSKWTRIVPGENS
ncbi:zinc finger protein 501-like [Culicoides brevitarsis]|uniref:zinc finger protein 501-like n=1 Tax=Culicoides brevitarsis TaxID=469753 RepID=UPI00307C9022